MRAFHIDQVVTEICSMGFRFTVSHNFFLQAIAAMMRAQEADPTNLEVLLALGVSHTNGICYISFSASYCSMLLC